MVEFFLFLQIYSILACLPTFRYHFSKSFPQTGFISIYFLQVCSILYALQIIFIYSFPTIISIISTTMSRIKTCLVEKCYRRTKNLQLITKPSIIYFWCLSRIPYSSRYISPFLSTCTSISCIVFPLIPKWRHSLEIYVKSNIS